VLVVERFSTKVLTMFSTSDSLVAVPLPPLARAVSWICCVESILISLLSERLCVVLRVSPSAFDSVSNGVGKSVCRNVSDRRSRLTLLKKYELRRFQFLFFW